jgi:hypothetical protein
MWDFTIRERAEQYWAEADAAANEQRRVKQILEARAASRRRAAAHRERRGEGPAPWWWLGLRRFARGLVLIVALGLLLADSTHAATPAARARALAENILGTGTVKAISTADHGRTVAIRWESPTFKVTNTVAASRELLYAEAVLASSAIMASVPETTRVRFAIVRHGRPMAGGEAVRGRATLLVFSAELGGGVYEAPVTVGTTVRPGGMAEAAL